MTVNFYTSAPQSLHINFQIVLKLWSALNARLNEITCIAPFDLFYGLKLLIPLVNALQNHF